jgi:hypothetical protein
MLFVCGWQAVELRKVSALERTDEIGYNGISGKVSSTMSRLQYLTNWDLTMKN